MATRKRCSRHSQSDALALVESRKPAPRPFAAFAGTDACHHGLRPSRRPSRPPAGGLCAAGSVNGAPFVRPRSDAAVTSIAECQAAAISLQIGTDVTARTVVEADRRQRAGAIVKTSRLPDVATPDSAI